MRSHAAAPADRLSWTPPEIAARWRVSEDKIHALIRAGRLRAFDVASPGSTRPRWRVPLDALLAFEAGRSPETAAPKKRRRREAAVIEFF
jgi:hypothetical protein